jgi:hypothetical protein
VSARDIGLGSIISLRDLIVPPAVPVFIDNFGRISRNDLLLCRTFRREAGSVVCRKSLRERSIDPIGPTPVMFDDFVCYPGHISLLAPLKMARLR